MCSADIAIRWTWMIGPEVRDGLDAGHAVAYARRAGREIGFEGRDRWVVMSVEHI